MSYFKDLEGNLHDDDNGRATHLLPIGSIKITDEEYESLLNPPETPEQIKDRVKAELAELERNALMPRGAREAFIVLCEQQGTSVGLTKEQLYAANPFYKGLIDTDNAARALRAQL